MFSHTLKLYQAQAYAWRFPFRHRWYYWQTAPQDWAALEALDQTLRRYDERQAKRNRLTRFFSTLLPIHRTMAIKREQWCYGYLLMHLSKEQSKSISGAQAMPASLSDHQSKLKLGSVLQKLLSSVFTSPQQEADDNETPVKQEGFALFWDKPDIWQAQARYKLKRFTQAVKTEALLRQDRLAHKFAELDKKIWELYRNCFVDQTVSKAELNEKLKVLMTQADAAYQLTLAPFKLETEWAKSAKPARQDYLAAVKADYESFCQKVAHYAKLRRFDKAAEEEAKMFISGLKGIYKDALRQLKKAINEWQESEIKRKAKELYHNAVRRYDLSLWYPEDADKVKQVSEQLFELHIVGEQRLHDYECFPETPYANQHESITAVVPLATVDTQLKQHWLWNYWQQDIKRLSETLAELKQQGIWVDEQDHEPIKKQLKTLRTTYHPDWIGNQTRWQAHWQQLNEAEQTQARVAITKLFASIDETTNHQIKEVFNPAYAKLQAEYESIRLLDAEIARLKQEIYETKKWLAEQSLLPKEKLHDIRVNSPEPSALLVAAAPGQTLQSSFLKAHGTFGQKDPKAASPYNSETQQSKQEVEHAAGPIPS